MTTIGPVMTSLKAIDRLKDDIAAAGIAAGGSAGCWVTRPDIEDMTSRKGAYILAVRLGETIHLELPRMAGGRLLPGWYAYAGSANGSGGIRARVRRHFRGAKKLHWHIDRLTANAPDMAALAVTGGNECRLVERLLGSGRFKTPLTGFGSTDCRRCESHLLGLR